MISLLIIPRVLFVEYRFIAEGYGAADMIKVMYGELRDTPERL